MRDIIADNITEAVQQAWNNAPDPRLRHLLQRLTHHVHAFVREVGLTHEEWLATVDFLWRAGQISDDKRNEFALLSDVMGVTSLVDLLNATPGATIGSVLGPFYSDDSPTVPFGADLVKDNEGTTLLVTGVVRDTAGKPIPGAIVDMWQTDAKGEYATQDAAQDDDNLRCKQECDAEGRYAFTTVEPAPYTIPMDGPVGAVVAAAGRSPWRPSHLHFIVKAERHKPIVTEIFFTHDKFVDNDAVFGVREPLVRELDAMRGGDAGPPGLERRPDKRLDFDFTLVPLQGNA
ncbi:dioxygenase [Mesorhizobium helmanticense]|uniref:Intradiol ring-cleavage dioxygenase n=1 Tax=Mesorhizobium helmanticense TaxID=1776423 RepID=A0A2T4IMN7_9HYPH|nr:dioxygenase [Mesorhizobium helmanticense]PTE06865.1 intradiol ring-cleavage dioxygenase [Mesorhizobium helmanticense]